VAESLAAETPVITSDFGSMRELAAAGGALTIDPHDDAALVTAMRTLLTDAGELERLRLQIADRPLREWDDYAAELWAALITPLLSGDEQ
jgi:glycosyltransferase involved in cell wall biosynthesis